MWWVGGLVVVLWWGGSWCVGDGWGVGVGGAGVVLGGRCADEGWGGGGVVCSGKYCQFNEGGIMGISDAPPDGGCNLSL